MLFFHKIALEEVSQDSSCGSLMIMSKGLGLEKVINSMLTIYAHPSSLVLILNNNPFEFLAMKKALEESRERSQESSTPSESTSHAVETGNPLVIDPGYLKEIDADINAKDRANLYLGGGVLAVSSRILVVDLLNKVIPVEKIRGIIINHAHRVSDTSPITFILRLYRQGNKLGFIRAFSDQPDSFVSNLERMMKALQVRMLALWPRFQVNVRKDVEEKGSVELIEIRVPFTAKMKSIQSGLIECLNQMLLELKRLHPYIDKDELKLEKAFSRNFDLILRSQLDGIWQNASSKTKNLVADLKTVRQLLEFLAQYDAVSFYAYLETEKETVAAATKSAFKSTTFTWLHLDSANIAFSEGRKRVYLRKPDIPQTDPNIPKGYQIVVEEQPKWRALIQVLREIVQERHEKYEDRGSVLVICRGGKTCEQLRHIIAKTDLSPGSGNTRGPYTSPGTKAVLWDQLYEYFLWKGGMAGISKALVDQTGESASSSLSRPASDAARPIVASSTSAPASKRRRIRPGTTESILGAPESFQQEAQAISESIRNDANRNNAPRNQQQSFSKNNTFITIRAYAGFSSEPGKETPDSTILDSLNPRWIVIYDPDVAFVRRVEVFKADNPWNSLKVYHLVYDNSSEEQQFLTNLRREKESFEKLIDQKSRLVIPLDENGQVLVDSEEMFWKQGQGPIKNKKILVDVREFRSSLPLLIHARRIDIVPITIEVGDYILSPSICIERKSPSDLSQSLKSGRLYKQAQAMTLHYTFPMLLIEYPQQNSFQLTFSPHENEMDTCRRLCLLLVHFPKLFLMWCSSPVATAEQFEDLQRDQPDPDVEKAKECGVESGSKLDSATNQTPCDMLLSIPGISFHNYTHVMNKVKNLKQLSVMSEEECVGLLGGENGRKVFHYFNDPCAVTVA